MTNIPLYKRLQLLFVTFFKIALFVVGGGLAMLPVIEEKFVKKHKLLTEDDMLDMIVITQTVPGLIAINSAVFVGTRVAGFIGALVGSIAVCLPSVIIILIIATFFRDLDTQNPILEHAFGSVRACITGVFFVTAIRLAKKVITDWISIIVVSLFFVGLIAGTNPLLIILCSLPLGICYLLYQTKNIKKVTKG